MKVQSLSIVIPAKCPNRCPFCVSHLNQENKYFRKHSNVNSVGLYESEVKDRMEFARDNDVNTLMITSTGEALENIKTIDSILNINSKLPSSFKWIELQTSGFGLVTAIKTDPFIFHQLSTISLSVVDIFNSTNNKNMMVMPKVVHDRGNSKFTSIKDIIWFLKDKNFNVRLSINVTKLYDDYSMTQIMERLLDLDVDQVTFRKLYTSNNNTKQDKWIIKNTSNVFINRVTKYVLEYGLELERLPFGAMKYSLQGISTVIDDDCMSKNNKDVLKYLIIRENAKLYSRWDDKGSLIF